MEIVVLALAPAVFWLWWFYRKDHLDPEPRSVVAKIFFLGMLPVLPAGLLEFAVFAAVPWIQTKNLLAIVLSNLLVIAPIEEYGKYWVVRRWAYRDAAFNEPLDGIIYSTAAALGFAALENLFYLLSGGPWLVLVRGPLSTLGHVLFSAAWGYALGMAWAQTDPGVARRLVRNGLLYAILGHAAFNVLFQSGQIGAEFALLPLLVFPLMFLQYRQVSANIQTSLAASPFQLRVRKPRSGSAPTARRKPR